MSERKPRRVNVEPGIYVSEKADGSQVYEITYRNAGQQKWRRVTGGLRAARTALAQAKADASRGVPEPVNPRLTFNQAADGFEEIRLPGLRPSTQHSYRYHLALLRKRFGTSRMDRITATQVAKLIRDLEAQGLKGNTISGTIRVFGGVHKHAVRHMGLRTGNPAMELERAERPKRQDQKEKRILNDEEMTRFINAAPERCRLIFEFAAQTGARLSETLGITWDNVDFENETVRFTHQATSYGKRMPLKTARSRRTIEAPPGLFAKLKRHKMQAAQSGPHDFVFVGVNGLPYNPDYFSYGVVNKAAKKAGLEAIVEDDVVLAPPPTFHSLRHTHASKLIARGFDIEEVSARLGHANVAVTQTTYVHAFDAARRSKDRRKRLAAIYADEAGTPPSNR